MRRPRLMRPRKSQTRLNRGAVTILAQNQQNKHDLNIDGGAWMKRVIRLSLWSAVFLLALHATAWAQAKPTLLETTSFIKDFLDAHGCVTIQGRNLEDTRNVYETKCTRVTAVSGCNLTLTHTVTSRWINGDPSGTMDLSSLDPSAVSYDGSKYGNRISMAKSFMFVDNAESGNRLLRALKYAIGLCKAQTPF